MLVRPLGEADAAMFRRIRLEALESCPTAFGASHAEAALHSEADYAKRIAGAAPGAVFGAFLDRPLVGIAGLAVQDSAKTRHKGTLWGVYVQSAHARAGLGRALVEAVIALARTRVTVLQAGVQTENTAARRLYLDLGFRPYGVEPKALCVDGVFYDEEHLALDFSNHSQP